MKQTSKTEDRTEDKPGLNKSEPGGNIKIHMIWSSPDFKMR